jgi:hypothetical protein
VTSLAERFDAPDVTSTDDCGTLPVELLFFEGEHQSGISKLRWQTASETNSAGFELLRSSDAAAFEAIAWLDSKSEGSGGAAYDFEEYVASNQDYVYYRLRQVDDDGSFYFSDIIALDLQGEAPKLSIFPNPAQGNVSVVLSAEIVETQPQLEIYDVLGRMVWRMEAVQIYNQLNLSHLQGGMYILKIKNNSKTLASKSLCIFGD